MPPAGHNPVGGDLFQRGRPTMKYEEWIQYERDRLDEQKRRVVERLEREEEDARQLAEQEAYEEETKPKYKGHILPNPPSLPS